RLGDALEEVPEDHILMATDYPHSSSEWPHTVGGIRERSDITARQKDMILGENAAALLNLPAQRAAGARRAPGARAPRRSPRLPSGGGAGSLARRWGPRGRQSGLPGAEAGPAWAAGH